MKIFITDGSGFVGQNLIPLLIAKGYSANALVRSKRAIDTIGRQKNDTDVRIPLL